MGFFRIEFNHAREVHRDGNELSFGSDFLRAQKCDAAVGTRANTKLNLFGGALDLVAQHDGFGDFAHGLSSLAALALQS